MCVSRPIPREHAAGKHLTATGPIRHRPAKAARPTRRIITSVIRNLAILLTALPLLAQDYDLLIRNGRIVDGTGNPSYHADLALTGNRVAALGKLTGKTAKRTIDASGLVVAPGFIDIHNHSSATATPKASSARASEREAARLRYSGIAISLGLLIDSANER